jgi:hypothetical protein
VEEETLPGHAGGAVRVHFSPGRHGTGEPAPPPALGAMRLHRYGRLPPVHGCAKHVPSLLAHLFVEKSSVNAEVGVDAPEVMGVV